MTKVWYEFKKLFAPLLCKEIVRLLAVIQSFACKVQQIMRLHS
jgi:hypothetical protein